MTKHTSIIALQKIVRFIKRITKLMVRNIGYDLRRISHTNHLELVQMLVPPSANVAYIERNEYGPSNIETKLQKVDDGELFEPKSIQNLNLAVIRLVEDESRIVELGAGTGFFAYHAAKDSSRTITASEYHTPTYQWAQQMRSRPNIHYVNGPISLENGPFDLVVAIEVIEHVWDFPGFLKTCTSLAPRALITTPNRYRRYQMFDCGPPSYFKHVREWNAGEFYWVLRCFYKNVRLYAITSNTEPDIISVSVNDLRSGFIADCRQPIADIS